MPWSSFEKAMEPLMMNHVYGTNMDGWAKQFTTNYHLAILSGGDMINKIKIMKPNKTGMEEMLKAKLKQVQPSTSTTLLDVIGPAVKMYWTGATMMLAPPPLIPAPGAIKNLVTNQAPVLQSGTWSPIPVQPNTDSKIFLKAFIAAATSHLMTVGGIYVVTALYPGVPSPVPGPGVVKWQGYMV